MIAWVDRLRDAKPLLLDGATGSELERRGVPCVLPLWSAVALLQNEYTSILRTIHAEYIQRGAQIITANTFRLNRQTLMTEQLHNDSRRLICKAVDTVREAIESVARDRTVFIAGSIGPVEDCYHPERAPADDVLRDDHHRRIDDLYAARPDLILIETMNNMNEAAIATEYAVQTGLPVAVSFIARNDTQLLSGESLEKTILRIKTYNPAALMLNCMRVEIMEHALDVLKDTAGDIPIGVYANIFPEQSKPAMTPDDFASRMEGWVSEYKLKIIGGCCGTTPRHIEKLADRIGVN